ncbi:MAG: hypothetical protein J7540_02925, partial [Roseofilum sp. SID2]|uniref:hypothetical protein n=1 Tax=unclassified Roseofilum TaxID=2620099 RepID=UPI001AFFC256
EHPLYPLLMADLAAVHVFLGDRPSAEILYEKAQEKALRIHGKQHQVAIAIIHDYHSLCPRPNF